MIKIPIVTGKSDRYPSWLDVDGLKSQSAQVGNLVKQASTLVYSYACPGCKSIWNADHPSIKKLAKIASQHGEIVDPTCPNCGEDLVEYRSTISRSASSLVTTADKFLVREADIQHEIPPPNYFGSSWVDKSVVAKLSMELGKFASKLGLISPQVRFQRAVRGSVEDSNPGLVRFASFTLEFTDKYVTRNRVQVIAGVTPSGQFVMPSSFVNAAGQEYPMTKEAFDMLSNGKVYSPTVVDSTQESMHLQYREPDPARWKLGSFSRFLKEVLASEQDKPALMKAASASSTNDAISILDGHRSGLGQELYITYAHLYREGVDVNTMTPGTQIRDPKTGEIHTVKDYTPGTGATVTDSQNQQRFIPENNLPNVQPIVGQQAQASFAPGRDEEDIGVPESEEGDVEIGMTDFPDYSEDFDQQEQDVIDNREHFTNEELLHRPRVRDLTNYEENTDGVGLKEEASSLLDKELRSVEFPKVAAEEATSSMDKLLPGEAEIDQVLSQDPVLASLTVESAEEISDEPPMDPDQWASQYLDDVSFKKHKKRPEDVKMEDAVPGTATVESLLGEVHKAQDDLDEIQKQIDAIWSKAQQEVDRTAQQTSQRTLQENYRAKVKHLYMLVYAAKDHTMTIGDKVLAARVIDKEAPAPSPSWKLDAIMTKFKKAKAYLDEAIAKYKQETPGSSNLELTEFPNPEMRAPKKIRNISKHRSRYTKIAAIEDLDHITELLNKYISELDSIDKTEE